LPGHGVITKYYVPSCQPLAEQLTVNAATNQTGYDLYYSGAYFPSGKQVQITLSGGFLMGSENVGTATVKSNGSFTGYRLLTCPPGPAAPQSMFLNADATSTPVSFSCAVGE
jgi:hypothetical protein